MNERFIEILQLKSWIDSDTNSNAEMLKMKIKKMLKIVHTFKIDNTKLVIKRHSIFFDVKVRLCCE